MVGRWQVRPAEQVRPGVRVLVRILGNIIIKYELTLQSVPVCRVPVKLQTHTFEITFEGLSILSLGDGCNEKPRRIRLIMRLFRHYCRINKSRVNTYLCA